MRYKAIIFLSVWLCLCLDIFGQWTSDPLVNTLISNSSGEQALPKIAVCTNGDLYVAWFSNETGNYNVRLQLLDKDGNPLWIPNGILVSDHQQMTWLTDWDLSVDTENYALLTFQDIRAGSNNPVGYRISPDGEMLWGANGVQLSNSANFEPSPKVCGTDTGNAVFAWQSEAAGGSEIHLQKVDAAGNLLWGEGIVYSSTTQDYTYPYLYPATEDQVFLIWHKQSGPAWSPNRGLYVQLLDENGSFIWENDLEIYSPVASGAVITLQMGSDYNGGLVFAWYYNDAGTHFNCKVQYMDADGSLSMPANGITVSTFMGRNHMYPAPAFLPETNEIIVYFSEQDLNQNQRGLYAQKFNLAGNRLWSDQGKQLIALSNNDYSLPIASGLDNKAICIYQAHEFMNINLSKIQAVMLESDGSYVWDDEFVDMSTYQSSKLHMVMTDYYFGQWVAVWEDERNASRDIYAQNIQKDGTLGKVVTSVTPFVVSDGTDVKVAPNPIGDYAIFTVSLANSGDLRLEIFNAGGQKIHHSVQFKKSGESQISWNATGLPAGVYYYTILINDYEKQGKLIKR